MGAGFEEGLCPEHEEEEVGGEAAEVGLGRKEEEGEGDGGENGGVFGGMILGYGETGGGDCSRTQTTRL